MYSTSVGVLVNARGQELLMGEKNKAGYLLFGPYTNCEPGDYVVTFQLEVEGSDPTKTVVCGRADVTIDTGANIIAQTSLYGSRLSGPTKISLPFRLTAPSQVEFRVFTTGRFRMLVDPVPILQASEYAETKYCPVFPIGYAARHSFLDQFFGDIRFLFENGAEISEHDEGVVGTCNQVKFLLTNFEDFQIVNEVFFTNEYNIVSSRNSIFIDIGMNVGMTSLFAASNPNIDHVYSFEPFQNPFERAARNISLNPQLGSKITAYPFGMGSADQDLEVVVDPNISIGTSIRGNNSGARQHISIREAGTVLQDIVGEAKKEGKAIFLKIDCEGSEFAIFDSLQRAQLLKSFDVIMIEWHKWWSADLTQYDIINPLTKAGFIVFDRTTPANVFAGMLYAVRQ